MEMEQKVELINEKEMLALARDFEFETPLFGFFFKDGEGHRIDMFPGYCRHCQEKKSCPNPGKKLRAFLIIHQQV